MGYSEDQYTQIYDSHRDIINLISNNEILFKPRVVKLIKEFEMSHKEEVLYYHSLTHKFATIFSSKTTKNVSKRISEIKKRIKHRHLIITKMPRYKWLKQQITLAKSRGSSVFMYQRHQDEINELMKFTTSLMGEISVLKRFQTFNMSDINEQWKSFMSSVKPTTP
jgi:hypothetical protein